MGTTYRVLIAALPAGLSRDELHRQIEETLESVNEQMSTYRPDSEVSQFNTFTDERWFEVSPATAEVVSEAIRIAEATGGAFDPTVSPLVNAWNFGPAPGIPSIPSPSQIASIRDSVGFDKLEARLEPASLCKRNRDLQIDLSGIAKGYAVDRVAELLSQYRVSAFLVEVGGETRVSGTKSNGRSWSLGIEAPVEGRRSLWRILALTDCSMATSGDYRNFFVADGQRYAHIIDPRTAAPTKHTLASVTVVHAECIQADALATALTVMGPEEGFRFALERDLAALFIVREGEGFRERLTPRFVRLNSTRVSSNEQSF
jgi:thiamine biosynthesis lipoprotein